MPVDLVITDLCVRFVARGVVDLAEIKDVYELAWAHPDFRLGMPYFADLQHGTLAEFQNTDPRRIASFIRSRLDQHGQVKTAFLSGRPVDHGIARMFEAYADIEADLPVRVCGSEEEALAWLRGEIE